jgi:DNA-binding transcriptional MerR regulator
MGSATGIGNSVDLLSIKDFSAFTGVKQSTLRYYDDIGLFSPAFRGENGYRYYSPQQIITINMIKVFNDLDVPIREISELERCRTPESILSLLVGKEGLLETELRRVTRAYDIIRTLRRMIHYGIHADESKLAVQYMEEQPLILGEENDFSANKHFYTAFLKFCDKSNHLRINLDYPVGGYFSDMEEFSREPGQPTRFFSVDPHGVDMKPAGNYLVGYNRSYYGETGDLPERMTEYAKENNLVFTGPVDNIFLLDEICVKNPEDYLLQVSVPVTFSCDE